MNIRRMTKTAMRLFDKASEKQPAPNTLEHLEWQERLDRICNELNDVEGEA